MTAYVIRHAKAGDRGAWEGDDRLRPLTKSGKHQADALAKQFKDDRIDAILSSPYARCVQTVEPLAREKRLAVEASDDLAEGAGGEQILKLMTHRKGNVAMCTHGDLVEELLELLVGMGLVSRARLANEKGGTWILDNESGAVKGAKYRAAP